MADLIPSDIPDVSKENHECSCPELELQVNILQRELENLRVVKFTEREALKPGTSQLNLFWTYYEENGDKTTSPEAKVINWTTGLFENIIFEFFSGTQTSPGDIEAVEQITINQSQVRVIGSNCKDVDGRIKGLGLGKKK